MHVKVNATCTISACNLHQAVGAGVGEAGRKTGQESLSASAPTPPLLTVGGSCVPGQPVQTCAGTNIELGRKCKNRRNNKCEVLLVQDKFLDTDYFCFGSYSSPDHWLFQTRPTCALCSVQPVLDHILSWGTSVKKKQKKYKNMKCCLF